MMRNISNEFPKSHKSTTLISVKATFSSQSLNILSLALPAHAEWLIWVTKKPSSLYFGTLTKPATTKMWCGAEIAITEIVENLLKRKTFQSVCFVLCKHTSSKNGTKNKKVAAAMAAELSVAGGCSLSGCFMLYRQRQFRFIAVLCIANIISTIYVVGSYTYFYIYISSIPGKIAYVFLWWTALVFCVCDKEVICSWVSFSYEYYYVMSVCARDGARKKRTVAKYPRMDVPEAVCFTCMHVW